MAMTGAEDRIRGEGWEVWRDAEGILWTRDSSLQTSAAAQRRVAAMERILARGGVRGVLVDDHKFAGGDAPLAIEVYAAFVRAHSALPFALVTTHRDSLRVYEAIVKVAGQPRNFQLFSTVQAARAWIVHLKGEVG